MVMELEEALLNIQLWLTIRGFSYGSAILEDCTESEHAHQTLLMNSHHMV